ncbi:MAG: hypothetical protein GY862_01535 [Gammaproteobacteria bacterium]|nr:hypothetical protein [Gammaproteobacteria bacterium]
MKSAKVCRGAAWAAFLGLNFVSTVFAATDNDINITHCTQCGQQLVGGASIDFDSIQWIGEEGGVILRTDHSGNPAFGFTGQPNYQTEYPVNNVWILETPAAGMLPGAQARNSASASHYFAPDQVESISATAQYLVQIGQDIVFKKVEVQGEGVIDSNEAITLDVTGVTNCAMADSICEKVINPGDTVNFIVTPHVDPALVPAGLSAPEHVMVELIVQEVNTSCVSNSLSSSDKTLTKNNFSPENYFHHLYGSGPDQTPALCVRQLPFLMNAKESLSFRTTGKQVTGDGYVDYTFFIRGHYDPNDPAKWPDSHKTFRIHIVNSADFLGMALSSMKTVISKQQADGAGTSTMVWLADANGNPVTNTVSGTVILSDVTGTINTAAPFPAGQLYVSIELGGTNGVNLSKINAGNTLQMVAAYANGVSAVSNSSQVPISVMDNYLAASVNSSVFNSSRPASRDAFNGFNVALDNETSLGSEMIRIDHMVKNSGSNMPKSIDFNEAALNSDGTLPVIFVNSTGNISTADDEFYLIGDTAGQYGQAVVMNQGMDANPDITGGAFSIDPLTGEVSVVNSPGVDGVSGVSVDGDAFKMSRTVNQIDDLTIAYTYNIDPNHQGQAAGLMMIGAYVDTQGLYSHLAPLGSPYPIFIYNKASNTRWNLWVQGTQPLSDLVSFENVTSLGATQSYDIYTGPTTGMPGDIIFYPAYRIGSSGSIIYPVTPIQLTVTP